MSQITWSSKFSLLLSGFTGVLLAIGLLLTPTSAAFAQSADLKVSLFNQTGDINPAGEQMTYTIVVDNLGPDQAEDIVVRDLMLAGNFFRANGCSLAVRTDGGLIDEFDCNFALSTGVFDLGTFGANWLNPRGEYLCDPNVDPGCTDEYDLGRMIITINGTMEEEMTLTNMVDVRAETFDPDLDNNYATTFIEIFAVADLGVTKTATTPNVNVGETASWEIEVTNYGPSSATNVELIDYLPAALVDGSVELSGQIFDEFDSPVGPIGCITGTPGAAGDPARCDLGGLPPDYSAVMTLSGLIANDYLDRVGRDSARVVNNVEVTTETFEAALDDEGNTCSPVGPCPAAIEEPNFANAAVIVGESADLSLQKFAVGLAIPGEVFHYEFQIDNAGPSLARDVTLRDFLPDGVEFLDAAVDTEGGSSFDPLPCTITAGSNALFCPIGDVPITGGAPIFVFVNVRVDETVPGGTVLENNADVFLSDTADPDGSNNSDSASSLVQSRDPRALEVLKTAEGELLQAEMLALELDISNPPPFPEAPNYVAVADRVNAGRRIRYTINVANTSTNAISGDALNVTLSDSLPAGVTVVPGSLSIAYSPDTVPNIPAGSCSLGTPGNPSDPMECGLGRLGEIGDPQYPNAVQIEFDVQVQPDLADNTVLTNNVTVTSSSEELDNSSSQAANQTIIKSPQLDPFTELFLPAGADLQGWLVEFTPDGSPDFYSASTCPIGLQLPVPSDEGKQLLDTLGDDDSVEIALADGKQILLYGIKWGSIHIGSNGYVTLGTPDTTYVAGLGAHFATPRISALFTDLNPAAGGEVWWVQRSDRVVISWFDVPGFLSATTNRVTLELQFDGTIRAWYRQVDPDHVDSAIVGLSKGAGEPDPFMESNFVHGAAAYPTCGGVIFFDGYEVY